MTSKLAIAKCQDYDPAAVYKAVAEALELLGGIGSYVTPGDTVLLKPNVLGIWEPEDAVTTHPSVVEAVARLVQDARGEVVIGESSGGSAAGKTEEALERCGIAEVARKTSSALCAFEKLDQEKRYVEMIDREIAFASPVMEADVTISLPKLKTHSLTGMTGAVKNMFGTIPGPKKSQMHREFPDKELFSKALVGIFSTVRPELSIMDGIVAMEGNGPAGGSPKQLGLILAGDDAVAMDAVITERIMKINPAYIDTIRLATDAGLGISNMDDIEILGPPLEEDELKKGFKPPITYAVYSKRWVPERFRSGIMKMVCKAPVPKITKSCIGCGDCVEVCPMKAAKLTRKGKKGKKAVIDLEMCISCFCCHETCKHGGVEPYVPMLWRMHKI